MYHNDQSDYDRLNPQNRGWYDDRAQSRQAGDWTGQHDPRHDQDHGRYQQRAQIREQWDNDLYHHAQGQNQYQPRQHAEHPTHNPYAQQASYQSRSEYPRQSGADQGWGFGQRQYNPSRQYGNQYGNQNTAQYGNQYGGRYDQQDTGRSSGQYQDQYRNQYSGQQYDDQGYGQRSYQNESRGGYNQPSYGQSGSGQGAYGQTSYGQSYNQSGSRQMENDNQRTSWNQRYDGSQSGGSYRPSFAGRGPKGYTRSDDRLKDEISDRFMNDHELDASEIEIEVENGEVTLKGTVESRQDKFRAEQLADSIMGVQDVTNNLRVSRNRSGRSSDEDGRSSGREGSENGRGSSVEAKGSNGSGKSSKDASGSSSGSQSGADKSESNSGRRTVTNAR